MERKEEWEKTSLNLLAMEIKSLLFFVFFFNFTESGIKSRRREEERRPN